MEEALGCVLLQLAGDKLVHLQFCGNTSKCSAFCGIELISALATLYYTALLRTLSVRTSVYKCEVYCIMLKSTYMRCSAPTPSHLVHLTAFCPVLSCYVMICYDMTDFSVPAFPVEPQILPLYRHAIQTTVAAVALKQTKNRYSL